jgi:hypothetical protein
MLSTASRYRYESLDLSSETIRLLRINRNDNDIKELSSALECHNKNRSLSDLDLKSYKSDIKFYKPKHVSEGSNVLSCSLHVFGIRDAPNFAALSYTWGSPDVLHDILVDGKRLTVRHNLWAALRTLKNHDALKEMEAPAEYFWIDAICIDQRNVHERNHQVSMMQRIFSLAQYVIAWLGEADEHSSHAIMALASRSKHWHFAEESREDFSKFERDLPVPFDYQNSLFTRAYWSRLWIVQEFVIPRNMIIMCGTMTCSWSELESVSKMVAGSNVSSNRDPVWRLFNLKHEYRVLREKNIKPHTRSYDMVGLFRNHECADPRDKIFGLSGLFSIKDDTADDAHAFVVDYSLAPKEVLTRFMSYVLDMFEYAKPLNLEHYVASLAIRMGVQPYSLLDSSIVLSILADAPLIYPEVWQGPMSLSAMATWLDRH